MTQTKSARVLLTIACIPLAASFLLQQTLTQSSSHEILARANDDTNHTKSQNKTRSYSDLTTWVNPFIGTDNYGDVSPGASIPFGMAKINVDCEGYAPAGYLANSTARIYGLSPLHDSGTGSSLGSYGNFEILPTRCPHGFDSCVTKFNDRLRLRVNGSDEASPGYFAITLDSPKVKLEATSTRRAGLERFTFEPAGDQKAYFVLDLSNDLPRSFAGGKMEIDPKKGRITLGGSWGSSFGPGPGRYQAFACYDLTQDGKQPLSEWGIWRADNYGMNAKGLGQTTLNIPVTYVQGDYESGALFSYPPGVNSITIRVGVSFVSADKACRNAEEEIGDQKSFEDVRAESVKQWNERLGRLEIPLKDTEEDIAVMIYSSMYRSFLTPNNATGETQGVFANTTSPYFDSLYCSWDTARTFYPWMNLHSPVESAQIAENYIDGWRKNGVIPECRANNLPGWTQGGSDGTNILADFALKYSRQAASLGVDLQEMYTALVSDAEQTPATWDVGGRQIGVYKQYQYIPYAVLDAFSTGRQTREGSRTLEYAFNDFGISQVAQLLNHPEDAQKYENRSLWYRNVWDPAVTSDGFKGFFQKRFANGSYAYTDPKACSPKDTENRPCSLQISNQVGFYESSSWEYCFYAPHDTAHLIELHGGNETFVRRLDHFFDEGYYLAGNEPSFQTPVGYHYAGQPANSVSRIRSVVRDNFNPGAGGIPGNDDQAAMATLLLFHLLGLYPVPSTTQYLVLSPWVPQYTLHNPYLNVSTTVRVTGYDKKSLVYPIPKGVSAYVQEVKFNGKTTASRCFVDFHEVFALGGELEIILTSDREAAQGCNGPLPDSLSTGGFRVRV
ncbi:glycoside hydrolase family 92 protein [Melampsora americana]|nr:glycoside hydrolase family 92 protein [Melampsora americana]